MANKYSRSDIWMHFIKSELGGKCKHCLLNVKSSGNTTNLCSHMIRKHKYFYSKRQMESERPSGDGGEQMQAINRLFGNSNRNNDEVIDDVEMEEISHANESLGLPTVSVVEINKVDTASTASDISAPGTSKSPTQPLIEDCISNIKAYECTNGGGLKEGKISNAIIYMIAKDDLPLNTTIKTGFLHLMKTITPLYKVPCRMTVTQMIDAKYDILSLKIKENMKQIIALPLTTDIWTDTLNTKSYIGLTGHFVEKVKLQSITFGVTELDEGHNAECVGRVVVICSNWTITSEKIKAVVTDNGANIVKAVVDLYGKNKHLPCFAHTLNLVANKPFEDKNGLDDVKALLNSVKAIVKHFKHSVQASDELRKAQDDMQTPLRLIQSVCTRWNSTYYQLERFIKLSDKVAQILIKNSKAPLMLTATELNSLKDLIYIFQLFEMLTKEISGQNYVTCSKIIPMVYSLTKSVETVQPNTELGHTTKTFILNEINKRFRNIEQVHLLAISTLLDPRFKKMYFRDKIACSQAIGKVISMLSDIDTEISVTQLNRREESDSHGAEEATSANNIWQFHEQLVKTKYPEEQENRNVVGMDFRNYLSQPVEDLKTCNPLKYWECHKDTIYKKLRTLAYHYFCIVGTLDPSERLFSIAANIVTLSRNRLSGERLNKLIFLKSLENNILGIA